MIIRELGEMADVEIEPNSQTHLCNKTMQLRGVIVAGVPGGITYIMIYT